jgi:DNA-binding transcriptional LysR family regulator
MNIESFDLNLLRVLDALLTERHVSRAATRLHLSQPATSAALARLRDALGDPLLTRGKQGMQPTARALELAPQVRAMLAQLGQVLAPPAQFDPATAQHAFFVAATDHYLELATARLTAALAAQAPGVRVAFSPVTQERLVAQMERGELDCAITNAARAPAQLRARLLLAEKFVGIARHNHPLLAKPVTLARFCAAPQVLVSPRAGALGSDPFHGIVDDALLRAGKTRRVALSVPQFRFAVDAVADSDLIAVFPAGLAAQHAARVARFKLPLEVPGFELGLVWHERTHRSAPHQWLRELLRQCAAQK